MDLEKLFSAQKKLRERINYNGEDRFEKLILALLVEIGECANEQRTWKFWSTDQEPRTFVTCRNCGGKGKGYFSGSVYTGLKEKCVRCEGTGRDNSENSLLEEYVDGLHFVLDLGIELGFKGIEQTAIWKISNIDVTEAFTSVYRSTVMLSIYRTHMEYSRLLSVYYRLGETLGFTNEQIEQAYFDKNQINHERQESGY